MIPLAVNEIFGPTLEEWRTTDKENYSVSSLGRIRNDRTNTILKGWLDDHGYRRVDLGKFDQRRVHVLIATAFLGSKPHPDWEPNHLDGNKDNNKATNLEWTTRALNMAHAYKLGLRTYIRPTYGLSNPGTANGRALMTWKKIREIRRLHNEEEVTYSTLANQFGLSYSAVSKICTDVTWKEVNL